MIEIREPDSAESSQIGGRLGEIGLEWAKALSPIELPDDLHSEVVPRAQAKAAFLARLAVMKRLIAECEAVAARDVLSATENGADIEDLAAAWGITRQAATKRWGNVLRGEQVVVVISRRSRVHEDKTDPLGSYGEVGGEDQYEADRGHWYVGWEVRHTAPYAVIAVEGTVRRIYEIKRGEYTFTWDSIWVTVPYSGRVMEKSRFTGTLMSVEQIEAAYADRRLPFRLGDPCPTKAGGAYRPHWF